MTSLEILTEAPMRPLPRLIFLSRWLQVPLYLGHIAFLLSAMAIAACDRIMPQVKTRASAGDIGHPGGHPGH